MAGLDNKISNIIGTKLPQWLLKQIELRSVNGARDSRDNDNILFLANKTAWVRLVSSIDLVSESDINYFNNIVGTSINDKSDLAKQYVLFGGTSKYLDKNSYQLRSGLGKDGAYGILGENEIQKYGYKPMPGITNVAIETQGRLGSVRSATINFKCWDKAQLDIIDALYFKLGFTMFLEWGNTAFYTSKEPNRIQSSELYSIDPFQSDLSKEEICIQLAKNSRESEGNYDGMLGIVTNFSFTFTQDGGFDCQLRLMALGVLSDSIKINNIGTLPGIVEEEIRILNNTLIQISESQNLLSQTNVGDSTNNDLQIKDLLQKLVLDRGLYYSPLNSSLPKLFAELPKTPSGLNVFNTISFKSDNPISKDAKREIRLDAFKNSKDFIVFPSAAGFYISNENQWKSLDANKFQELDYYTVSNVTKSTNYTIGKLGVVLNPNDNYSNIVLRTEYLKARALRYLNRRPSTTGQDILNTTNTALGSQSPETSQNLTLSEIILSTEQISQPSSQPTVQYSMDTSNIKYTISKPGRTYSIKYENEIRPYFFNITIPEDVRNSIGLKLASSDYKKIIESIFSKDTFESPNLVFNSTRFVKTDNSAAFFLTYQYPYAIDRTIPSIDQFTGAEVRTTQRVTGIVDVEIVFNDSSVFSNIDASNDYLTLANYKSLSQKIVDQNQTETKTEEEKAEKQKALDTQIREALNTQSALELTLRAIQLHALNKAIINRGNDLDIGKLVYTLNIADPDDKTTSGATFLNQIFSNGIFSSFINNLAYKINKSTPISIEGYNDNVKSLDRLQRLQIQAKYGFATSLMGNSADISTLKECDFQALLQAFVVPYQINQEIVKGTSTNHPVYIPFGLLLMILNHCCTIYDSKKGDKTQTPLVYIDFNTEHNFFLTNTKQLSTNPWVTLIPFQGNFDDYKKLFPNDILDGNNIKPPSGSAELIPLFDPTQQDALSGQIPQIKFDNIYRGSMMNILLNIDYLVKTVKDFSYRDGTNSIYLKEFIEQILTDLNKYLGKINVFRLSYNDKGNTLQIVDDQFIPVKDEEEQISPNDVKTLGTILSTSNTTELPLFGKYSIAKSLDIKSDMSSKLANTLAISANADVGDKANLSRNGDNYGYINTSYQDRFINRRSEVQNTNTGSKVDVNLDSIINSAIQFNQTISDFYSKINPSETSVDQATNYFIDKMAKIKNDEYPTRASAMIPVSVNFSTDGVSGFLMGQAFTISDELLPYTYNARNVTGAEGLGKDHINKVGFVVVGLSHALESNQWTTSVRANMIFLKNKTDFNGTVAKVNTAPIPFQASSGSVVSSTIGQASLGDLNVNQPWEEIAFDFISKKEGFLSKPKDDEGTLRAGYGTDKIVLATGEIKSVGSDTVFTREDGKRTLIYQIRTTFARRVITQIGQDKWNSLNDKQKAALVSFTYNVGSLTKSVVNAILSNTGSTTVASAIIKGPVTGQKSGFLQALQDRRKQEAALYLS